MTDAQEPGEKRHLLRWWNDTSGRTAEELRAAGPLPCFGERLVDAAGHDWIVYVHTCWRVSSQPHYGASRELSAEQVARCCCDSRL